MRIIRLAGGITAVPGIRAAGIHCGIKPEGKDLALIVSDPPAVAAGLFTQNKVKSESLKLTLNHIKYGLTKAILINSGNANCCTGPEGYNHARELTHLLADYLNTSPHSILLASTGIIGKRLPLNKIKDSLPRLIQELSTSGGGNAAEAILTTDKIKKEVAFSCDYQGLVFHVGGMAKGAGMIHPHLATMLCFLATDLNIEKTLLQKALKRAVDESFNRITIDGDTSTNDTVICLANGRAANERIRRDGGLYRAFQEVLSQVTLILAQLLLRDGEGVNKVIEIRVRGAETVKAARLIARTVANSLLVKTAFYGNDPNWGRLMMAIGRAGCRIIPEKIDISLDNLYIVKGGMEVKGAWEAEAARILAQDRFCVNIDLKMGKGEAIIWTCDLSVEYVKFNSHYTT